MTYIPHALTVCTTVYSPTLHNIHSNQHTHCMKQYGMVCNCTWFVEQL